MRPRQNPLLSYDRRGLGNEPRQPVVIPTASRTWEVHGQRDGYLYYRASASTERSTNLFTLTAAFGATRPRRAQEVSATKITPPQRRLPSLPDHGSLTAGGIMGRSASARVAPASGVGVHSPDHARPSRPRDYPAPEDRIRHRRACRHGARYRRRACGGACGA